MAKYEITADMNLKSLISEAREVVQALSKFADDLERIDRKYTETTERKQFEYVPRSQIDGATCDKCKYFKIIQEPLRGMSGLMDLGRAECKRHDLITDFANNGKFKHLKPCDFFEEGEREG